MLQNLKTCNIMEWPCQWRNIKSSQEDMRSLLTPFFSLAAVFFWPKKKTCHGVIGPIKNDPKIFPFFDRQRLLDMDQSNCFLLLPSWHADTYWGQSLPPRNRYLFLLISSLIPPDCLLTFQHQHSWWRRHRREKATMVNPHKNLQLKSLPLIVLQAKKMVTVLRLP